MPSLFQNVPPDVGHFFDGPRPDAQKIASFFKYKTSEIASATNLPAAAVRLDDKIPSELIVRLREWGLAINRVAQFFHGDLNRTYLWFTTKNPLLGEITPRDMIRIGRFEKLMRFIQDSLDENKPEEPAAE